MLHHIIADKEVRGDNENYKLICASISPRILGDLTICPQKYS